MNVRVEVTPESIAAGVPKFPSYCPIALALVPLLSESFSVFVEEDWAGIYREGPDVLEGEIDLPVEASAFVAAFDARQPVEPFAFEIDLPEIFRREVSP